MDGRARAGAMGGHSVPGHQPRGRCRIPQGRPRGIRCFCRRTPGFEFDVERYNHFFKDKDVADLVPNNCGVGPRDESCVDLNTDAIGFMGNVMAPIRITNAKNWRPYATAGLGVIHSWVTDLSNTVADTNQNNFAFNVGGGVMYSLKIAWPCEGTCGISWHSSTRTSATASTSTTTASCARRSASHSGSRGNRNAPMLRQKIFRMPMEIRRKSVRQSRGNRRYR